VAKPSVLGIINLPGRPGVRQGLDPVRIVTSVGRVRRVDYPTGGYRTLDEAKPQVTITVSKPETI
jgi:hypothetical protein